MKIGLKKNKISHRVNILVVDDEETMRSLLLDVLVNAGYNVEVAFTGEEAIEKIKHTPFEILITDLKMPGMNGIELMKRFKEINSNICIIVITGYPSVETAVEAIKRDAYDYITKPFDLEEFKIVVKRAAEKQILQREKEIYKELAITDGLTGVYNYRYFQEVLSREINRTRCFSRPFSLMMVDIDDFKIYNETNGHPAGDEVLKTLAQLLIESIRKVDLAFRYGGEEFVIILSETGKEAATVIAKCIRNVVEETKFKYADVFPAGRLTVSIALVVYPDDAQSGNELILKADQVLSQAKRLGKNRVSFFENKEIKTVNER